MYITKKIIKVKLILENCESIIIPIENIRSLCWFLDKEYWILYNCFSKEYVDSYILSQNLIVNKFIISIEDLDKLLYFPLGDNTITKKVIDRLIRSPDITHVSIEYDNLIYENNVNDPTVKIEHEEYSFVVPWGSRNQWINTYQIISKKKCRSEQDNIWNLIIKKRFTIKTLYYDYKEFKRWVRRNIFHNYSI